MDLFEQCPDFASLWKDLETRVLTPDGTTRGTSEALEASRAAVRNERSSYLTQALIMHEVEEIVRDYQLRKRRHQDVAGPQLDDEAATALEHVLAVERTAQFVAVPGENGPETNLFGVDKAYLREDHYSEESYQELCDTIANAVPEVLEARIKHKRDLLADFLDPSTRDGAIQLQFGVDRQPAPDAVREGKAHNLASIAQKLLDETARYETELMDRRNQFDTAVWEYYGILGRTLETLEILLEDYKFSKQPKIDECATQWLAAQCLAFTQKLRKYTFQADAYTAETVPALRVLHDHLAKALREAKQKYDGVKFRLDKYEHLDEGIDECVHEFARLKKELHEKKWALSQLVNKE